MPGPQTARAVVAAPLRLRFLLLGAIFGGWALIILGRLLWLQVFNHTMFVDLATRQQQRTFEVAPRRGVLYDRNLHELAMTVLVDSIYGVPTEMHDKDGTAAALARVVHADPTDGFTTARGIDARFHASKNFAWVARKVDAGTVARVKALNLKGVYFQKEFKRFYPNGSLAAQVLGYVGTDDDGLGGMERRFDEDLHGAPGHMLTALDAKRHVLGSEERDPLPGENLELTIDENIQFMAEHALDHAMEKVKALNGTVVVQDAHTGQILALAIRPTFDPNDFRHATTNLLRNHAVSDIYEPGSTFKLVTYSAALDAAGVQPDDMVDCQGGKITLFGRTIHDDSSDHGMGVVTVQRALERSSDVGAVKMALKLGPDKFYEYMKAYGFGSRSGVELPSETRGLLRPPRRWGATSIGSLAIGQEVGVTPVQLVSMVSTIANGGTYLPPHILMQTSERSDRAEKLKAEPFHPEMELPQPLPEGSHRVISELTSAKMRKMMEGIVVNGTGRLAALNGYSAAGKTGTAQKIDVLTHTYSHTKYVASFAGFAPVNNPAISVAVIIDSPVGAYHGAAVSAPVFQEVAQEVLEYLGVPHDTPLKPEKELEEAKKQDVPTEAPSEHTGDLQALFAEVNDLPADDPLRNPEPKQQPLVATADAAAAAKAQSAGSAAAASFIAAAPDSSEAPARDAQEPKVDQESVARAQSDAAGSISPPSDASPLVPASQPTTHVAEDSRPLVMDDKHRVAVPSFAGESLRRVVEDAGTAGLGLQLLGTGIAREQAPAAGTMVPLGTEIVVRFAR
ncbi:MAG: peptidoglycan D,D-transpeptidase FtsI family protein [Acidobacteriaceae bacterium]